MLKNLKVLLTGATGFVGGRVAERLIGCEGKFVTLVLRSSIESVGCRQILLESFSGQTDWKGVVDKQDVVIHCAGITQLHPNASQKERNELREVNVFATTRLAMQAAEAGVKRFIFVSSIKVNGNLSGEKPFLFNDLPAPACLYGASKLEAEERLIEISKKTDMEVVIIRPPAVYGRGVKGNFAELIKLTKKGYTLPFGNIANKRSFIGIDNLVDLLCSCIEHPKVGNKTFLVSDGRDLSTKELFLELGRAANKPAKLIYFPTILLKIILILLGRSRYADSLLGNQALDISHTKRAIGWEPKISVEDGLRSCFERDG